MSQILAGLVLYAVGSFIILPMIFSSTDSGVSQSYKDAVQAGFAFQFLVLIIGGFAATVCWSVNQFL